MKKMLLVVLLAMPFVGGASNLKVSCEDITPAYQDGYHDKLDLIIWVATNGQRGFTRYDEDMIQELCQTGDQDYMEHLIDYGYIKRSEAMAVKEILGLEKRSNAGLRWEKANNFLLDIGLCTSCASNYAYHYSVLSDSQCSRTIDKAMSGDIDALKELMTEPEYCVLGY